MRVKNRFAMLAAAATLAPGAHTGGWRLPAVG